MIGETLLNLTNCSSSKLYNQKFPPPPVYSQIMLVKFSYIRTYVVPKFSTVKNCTIGYSFIYLCKFQMCMLFLYYSVIIIICNKVRLGYAQEVKWHCTKLHSCMYPSSYKTGTDDRVCFHA